MKAKRIPSRLRIKMTNMRRRIRGEALPRSSYCFKKARQVHDQGRERAMVSKAEHVCPTRQERDAGKRRGRERGSCQQKWSRGLGLGGYREWARQGWEMGLLMAALSSSSLFRIACSFHGRIRNGRSFFFCIRV